MSSMRHGGESLNSANAFAALPWYSQQSVIAFLNSRVLFPPHDTASNLDPANPAKPNFRQYGHDSIKLTVLFNDPTDMEGATQSEDPGGGQIMEDGVLCS